MKQALLLYGSSEFGAPSFSGDILWRTGFRVPDPIILVEITGPPAMPGTWRAGKTFLFASALEFGRAKKQANVDHVILFNGFSDLVKFLKRKKVNQLIVPGSIPFRFIRQVKRVFSVEIGQEPFYPSRVFKSPKELQEIIKAQRATESSFLRARQFLKRSIAKRGKLYVGGKLITSELLRGLIETDLYAQGYFAASTIVAGGIQAADPHCIGSGPLLAKQAIVFDIFPVSLNSHYYADFTRTLFKGEPSSNLFKMYEAVSMAQNMAIKKIKAGVDGYDIQKLVSDYFMKSEYPTFVSEKSTEGQSPERVEGFIHGVGHGVGIDIHEWPRIGSVHDKLPLGSVVTVEPGLYYSRSHGDIPKGGIRIEDMVVVQKNGCKKLSTLPKDLKWATLK